MSQEETRHSESLLACHVPRGDARYAKYVELIDLMQIPVVEQVVLAKLVEMKVLARDVIDDFFQEVKEG